MPSFTASQPKLVKPIDLAKAMYDAHRRDFIAELHECLTRPNGFVVSTPTVFLMGKAVQVNYKTDVVHAWLIDMGVAAEGWPKLLSVLPFDLPFIAYYRRGRPRLHVLPIATFKKKAHQLCLS